MLYDRGIISSISPEVKTIVIGNLSLGGTGKTPHAALILSMLNGKKRAFLSRGYGRSSKGTVTVTAESTAKVAGDEPLLIARKYSDVHVVVAENRERGIANIMQHAADTDVIILDDALEFWTNGILKATQHRVPLTQWERYSIVLFYAANVNQVLVPLPEFVTPDRPPQYQPITQENHILQQVNAGLENLALLK